MAGDHPGVPGLGDASFNAGGRRSARSAPRGGDDENEAAEDETHGRSLTLASVARDARLDKKFLLLITLSSAIATLGLLQSSAAVVIGAMLVSPLLGPIMGVGFGLVAIADDRVMSSRNFLSSRASRATLASVKERPWVYSRLVLAAARCRTCQPATPRVERGVAKSGIFRT